MDTHYLPPINDDTVSEIKATGQKVKEETEQAMDKAAAYTQQQKNAYTQKIETKLDEIDRKMDALTAKAKDSTAELTDESREKFDQAML